MGSRRAALGGIAGPAIFVGSWAVLGAVKAHYSPVNDAISELAAVHASTRGFMTAGFVGFGIGLTAYAAALRAALAGPAWIAAATTGVATFGVAAFPLHHSTSVDSLHGACAGLGYVTLAATALLSVRPLRREGLRSWSHVAGASGALSAVGLALTLTGAHHGLFQRAGLTVGDVWIVASAVAMYRGGWGADAGRRHRLVSATSDPDHRGSA